MLLTIDLKEVFPYAPPRREFHNCRDLLKKRPYGDLEYNCMYAHGIFVYKRHVLLFPLNVLLRLAREVGSGSSVSAHSWLRALRFFCYCCALSIATATAAARAILVSTGHPLPYKAIHQRH